jgi:hypothetical protein
MDDSTFDQLTRSFALPSRRAVFSALSAALLPALFAQVGEEDALAKAKGGRRRQDAAAVQASGKGKKKKKKKKKKGKGGGKRDNDGANVTLQCALTCLGCCVGGVCHDGTDNALCGNEGEPCQDCTTEGKRCHLQTCTGCIKEECALRGGCCILDEECAPGITDGACGKDGEICDICSERGLVCDEERQQCCTHYGEPCLFHGDCCSGCCSQDFCAIASECCSDLHEPCTDHGDCCGTMVCCHGVCWPEVERIPDGEPCVGGGGCCKCCRSDNTCGDDDGTCSLE